MAEKKYKITLINGEVLTGTPQEIADTLRTTSYLEKDLSTLEYVRNFAKRNNKIYKRKIHAFSITMFFRTLLKSDQVIKYEILEN